MGRQQPCLCAYAVSRPPAVQAAVRRSKRGWSLFGRDCVSADWTGTAGRELAEAATWQPASLEPAAWRRAAARCHLTTARLAGTVCAGSSRHHNLPHVSLEAGR